MRIGFVYERKEWFPFRAGDPQDINSELLSEDEEAEIVAGLVSAGHQVILIGDVRRLLDDLNTWRQACDIVFNRSVGYRGTDRKSIAAALMDAAEMPYVGSSPYVLSLTRNKHHCKLIAEQAGLSTPSSAVLFGGLEDRAEAVAYPAIVKPIAESSSIGIETALAVVENADEARRQARRIAERYGQPALVETFIEGVEVEVPVVADAAGDMRVFGMAMVAVNGAAPQGRQYLASESVYTDDYGYVDPPAHVDTARLTMLAERGARALGIRDYGRLDFRIDNAGRMWFIEASTHPHVQVHSSFNHAAGQQKVSYPAMLDLLVQTGWRRHCSCQHLCGDAIG
jgi:D-alanine-D-alanine ligase